MLNMAQGSAQDKVASQAMAMMGRGAAQGKAPVQDAEWAPVQHAEWACLTCGNNNYASRTVCNRCSGPKAPPPGEGVREGDWVCPNCSNHNYAKRAACNKCQTCKPGFGGCGGCGGYGGMMQMMSPQSFAAAAPPTGGRPGDWSCEACGNHNYAQRTACNKCQVPKGMNPAGGAMMANFGAVKNMAVARASPYMMMGGGKGANMRPGDWVCPGCSNLNYSSREACNKCQRDKNLPPKYREGDWICVACKNHNYASKMSCNKCQTPK